MLEFFALVFCAFFLFYSKGSKITTKRTNNVFKKISKSIEYKRNQEFAENYLKNNKTMSPLTFFRIRKEFKGFPGVYIICNRSKKLFYVGQSHDVYQRCFNHFTGKGNGDIYADYKYGDEFSIGFISLESSGFDNLDELERFYIKKFNAVDNGYNKTMGRN